MPFDPNPFFSAALEAPAFSSPTLSVPRWKRRHLGTAQVSRVDFHYEARQSMISVFLSPPAQMACIFLPSLSLPLFRLVPCPSQIFSRTVEEFSTGWPFLLSLRLEFVQCPMSRRTVSALGQCPVRYAAFRNFTLIHGAAAGRPVFCLSEPGLFASLFPFSSLVKNSFPSAKGYLALLNVRRQILFEDPGILGFMRHRFF